MISRETIDDVKNRMDIVDVVGDFVTLKRSGQNYKALSPFTNEKTPSFYVVPSKGIFKDFSSGKGGDGITFIMEHEGLGYAEAIRYLAKKYGIALVENASSAADDTASAKDSLYILMNFAKGFYANLLFGHEDGQSIGLSYFRERGFNDRTVQKFELGYSLNEWDHFTRAALQQGYSADMLEKAGLTIRKDGGKAYDRFRGRVIFPVHNLSGKVIAFGARMLGKEKDQPKYINSPETEIYHKSQVLYGLFQAKNAIRKEGFSYLVEGYTDVISLHQAGIEHVVASSGTALTEDQIRLLKRFSENVTVLFDGDAAGIKAALRGVDLVLKEGLNVRVVRLPEGEDPDSYSRRLGSGAFQQYLKDHTRDFITFKIDLLAAEAAQDPIRKAEAIREMVSSIGLIPDPIKRSVYIRQTADLLRMDETVLLNELNKILIHDRQKKQQERLKAEDPIPLEKYPDPGATQSVVDPLTMLQKQERETIRLLLNYAELSWDEQQLKEFLLEELEDVTFTHPVYHQIYDAFRQGADRGEPVDSYYFMENGSEEVKKSVTELLTHKYETSQHWGEKYHIHFPHEREVIHDVAYSNVLRFKFRLIQKLMDDNMKEWRAAPDADWEVFFAKHERLKNAEKELAGALGIVIPR